eukprot:GILJ01004599.1.p1 GENE.GILJ01004599.1~~GILJ01004599.1.p1  ORF type:complete len:1826 (+),score=322.00 GILJ01004599.1:46-5478(+)
MMTLLEDQELDEELGLSDRLLRTEKASWYDRATHLVRVRTFQTIHLLSDKIWLGKNTTLFFLIIELVQLLYFPFASLPALRADQGGILSLFAYFSVDVGTFPFSANGNLLFDLFIFVICYLTVHFLMFIYLAYEGEHNEEDHVAKFCQRALKYSTFLLTTIFYIPFLNIIIDTLRCETLRTGLNPTITQCWTGVHGLFVFFCFIFGPLLVVYSVCMVLLWFDQSPRTNTVLARVHSRVECAEMISKTIICVVFGFFFNSSYDWLLFTALFGCFAVCLILHLTLMPFYKYKANQVKAAYSSALFWSAVCATVSYGFGRKDSNSTFILFFLPLPLICGLSYFFADFRLKWLIQQPVVKILRPYLIQVKTKLLAVAYIEQSVKFKSNRIAQLEDPTLRNEKRSQLTTTVNPKQEMEEQVKRIYKEAMMRLPESGSLHLSYGIHAFYVSKNRHMTQTQLTKAESRKLAFDEIFFAFKYRRLCEELAEQETGKSNVNSYIQYQKHLLAAAKHNEQARERIVEFWREVCEREPDFLRLEKIGIAIAKAVKEAQNNFAEVLKIYSQSPKVLRAYAGFLMDVLNDPNKAQELLTKAKHLEDTNLSLLRRKSTMGQTVGITDEELAINMFDEKNGVCMISASIDRLGTVFSINASVSRLFGFTRSEVVGANFKMLMPPMLGDCEDRKLAMFVDSGNQMLLENSKIGFGVHRSGHCFPFAFHIKYVSNWQKEASFMAFVKELECQEQFLLVNFPSMAVVAYSRIFSSLMMQSKTFTSAGAQKTTQVFISNIIPDLDFKQIAEEMEMDNEHVTVAKEKGVGYFLLNNDEEQEPVAVTNAFRSRGRINVNVYMKRIHSANVAHSHISDEQLFLIKFDAAAQLGSVFNFGIDDSGRNKEMDSSFTRDPEVEFSPGQPGSSRKLFKRKDSNMPAIRDRFNDTSTSLDEADNRNGSGDNANVGDRGKPVNGQDSPSTVQNENSDKKKTDSYLNYLPKNVLELHQVLFSGAQKNSDKRRNERRKRPVSKLAKVMAELKGEPKTELSLPLPMPDAQDKDNASIPVSPKAPTKDMFGMNRSAMRQASARDLKSVRIDVEPAYGGNSSGRVRPDLSVDTSGDRDTLGYQKEYDSKSLLLSPSDGAFSTPGQIATTPPQQSSPSAPHMKRWTMQDVNTDVNGKEREKDKISPNRPASAARTVNRAESVDSGPTSEASTTLLMRRLIQKKNAKMSSSLLLLSRASVVLSLLIIIALIIMTVFTRSTFLQSTKNFKAIDYAGSRRYLTQSIGFETRNLMLMNLAVVSPANEATTRANLLTYIEQLQETHTFLYETTAKDYADQLALYSTPSVDLLDQNMGALTIVKQNLWEAGMNFVSRAKLVYHLPLNETTIDNNDVKFVLLNGNWNLLQAFNDTTMLYNQNTKNTSAQLTEMQSIVVFSVYGLLGVSILFAFIPSLRQVGVERLNVLNLFMNMPNHLAKDMQQVATTRLSNFRQFDEGQHTRDEDEPSLFSQDTQPQDRDRTKASFWVRLRNSPFFRLWFVVVLAFLAFFGFFLALYLYAQDRIGKLNDFTTEVNYSELEKTTARRLRFFLQEYMVAPYTSIRDDPEDLYQETLAVANELAAIQNGILFGDSVRELPGTSGTLPGRDYLWYQDGCARNSDSFVPAPVAADCYTFDNGLLGHGLQPATSEYIRQVNAAAYSQNATIINLIASSAPAATQLSTAQSNLVNEVMTFISNMDLDYLRYSMEQSQYFFLSEIDYFVNSFLYFREVMVYVFIAVLVVSLLFLYMPFVYGFDANMKDVRSLLLLLPADVVSKLPQLKQMVHAEVAEP